jgi:hypothetical protein
MSSWLVRNAGIRYIPVINSNVPNLKEANNKNIKPDEKQSVSKNKTIEENTKQKLDKQEVVKQRVDKQGIDKQETIKQDADKLEQAKQEEIKLEQAKQEAIRQEQAKQEAIRQEQAKQEAIRQEQAKQEQAKQEAIRQEQARQEAIRQEQARRSEFSLSDKEAIEYCLDKYNLTEFPKNGKYAAILLDSRYTENILPILKQISRFLNSDWSVILYVTKDVYNMYLENVSKINSTIQIKELDFKLSNVADYNNIMLNIKFWENLKSFKKVLVFQSDTFMYKYGIEKFFNVDYIGAPWPVDLGTPSHVGNGGFSLRSVIPTINCLRNLNNIIIKNYKQYNINLDRLGRQPEDIIFSYGMPQLGYTVANVALAKHFSIETVEFNTNVIGSHRLEHFNKPFFIENYFNSVVPYFSKPHPESKEHRFGWNYVTKNLSSRFINKNGTLLHTWIDCDYLFNKKNIIPPNVNWVGITHLTPVFFEKYYSTCNINKLQKNTQFINDLKNCKGFFTLSTYMMTYLKNMLSVLGYPDIPVSNLYHPTCILEPFFDPNSIDSIKTVCSLGSQLRKNTTIFKLNTNYKKIWLSGRSMEYSMKFLEMECNEFNIKLTEDELNSVSVLYLDNTKYDEMIINSFVVIDMYNASANNSLIECIARDIPCFVINLPAVVEYIGEDYPLLFNNIYELEEKLSNKELILSAYKYLIDRPYLKERLTFDNFIKDILNSEVTKNVLTVNL